MTSGTRLAVLVIIVLVAATTTVNVFTQLHDSPGLARWEPAVWEYSSGLAFLPWLTIPWLAVQKFPPGRAPWLRLAVVHLLASAVFSAGHVGLFLVLRHLAYAVLDERYVFDLTVSELLYEYRKDLLSYVGAAAIFWLIPDRLRRRTPATPEETAPPEPATFEIRDGSRRLRAPVTDITAVMSAGNYVEFVLSDGRRPLTRATLASVEQELAPHGFIRTHRSWLVNRARVRSITSSGSGDHVLELQGGVTAPLSRRFRGVLAELTGA